MATGGRHRSHCHVDVLFDADRSDRSHPSHLVAHSQRVSNRHVKSETGRMQKISLDALARQQMQLALTAGGGHTADTVFGGHEKVLRQTVVAMVAGARLAEHENPGEATVLVLKGRLRLSAADLSWDAAQGDLLIVPNSRHSIEALEDCAFLLTVAKVS